MFDHHCLSVFIILVMYMLCSVGSVLSVSSQLVMVRGFYQFVYSRVHWSVCYYSAGVLCCVIDWAGVPEGFQSVEMIGRFGLVAQTSLPFADLPCWWTTHIFGDAHITHLCTQNWNTLLVLGSENYNNYYKIIIISYRLSVFSETCPLN